MRDEMKSEKESAGELVSPAAVGGWLGVKQEEGPLFRPILDAMKKPG